MNRRRARRRRPADRRGQADDDRPLDIDWRDQALETDSYADVAGSASAGASDEGFDFDRLEAGEASLSEHLLAQLHGLGGSDGALARH